jgi:1,4-alpha-glucan branching enzyme
MWLPELGYRPGLETLLADEGIKVFVCESHLLTGGPPVGVAAGDSRGPNSAVKRRYALVQKQSAPVRETSTMQPYWAGNTERITTIARDNRSTMQVWGEALGYPGDVDYRESRRQSGTSGLPYWRITGHNIGLPDKDDYHPEWARYKVEQHAEHFAHLIGDMIRGYHAETGLSGLIAPVFDMQLFGHWWFEGIDWLEQTCRHLANTSQIELTTISHYVTVQRPTDRVQLLEGSWGTGGDHFLVDNPQTHWLWTRLHAAEDRIEQIATKQFSDLQFDIFNQAVRQLLLLQGSDWATMITTRQADTYAIQQFNVHYERFEHLMTALETGKINDLQGKGHGEGRNMLPILSGLDVS